MDQLQQKIALNKSKLEDYFPDFRDYATPSFGKMFPRWCCQPTLLIAIVSQYEVSFYSCQQPWRECGGCQGQVFYPQRNNGSRVHLFVQGFFGTSHSCQLYRIMAGFSSVENNDVLQQSARLLSTLHHRYGCLDPTSFRQLS